MVNQEQIPARECLHVGVAVKDLEKTIELFSKVFGWGPWKRFDVDLKAEVHGKMTSYRGHRAITRVGVIELEFGETWGESVLIDFVGLTGGGLHHLAFKVDDLEKEVAKLKEMGISIIQSVFKEDGSRENVYLTTEETGNIVIELSA